MPKPRPTPGNLQRLALYSEPLRYDLLAQMTAPDDLPMYIRQVERWGGPILELGCGTGRVTLPLTQLCQRVVGIDNSPELLAHARLKSQAASLDPTLVEADFRNFDLGEQFSLVIFPYNAFNHLLDFDSIHDCLACVRHHLAAKGRFIIDTFNPDPAILSASTGARTKILEYIDPYTHERVLMYEANAYNAATQINNITWSYEVGGKPADRVDELEMRVFFPQELDSLVRLSGFSIEEKLGAYSGSPFQARSSKQIMVLGIPDTSGR